MKLVKWILTAALFYLVLSCTTEKIVTVEVEVEKENSWKEVTRFTREDKIIINTSRDENGIYFQQPGYMTAYRLKNGKIELNQYIKSLLTYDIYNKLPLNSNYMPIPYRDSLISLTIKDDFVSSDYSSTLFLKRIDTSFHKIAYPWMREEIMVINNNGVLLIHYYDKNGAKSNYKFFLIGVGINKSKYPFIYTTFTKIVEIEKSVKGLVGHQLIYFASIDDYFIIDLGDDGVYKMYQDGNFKKVIDGYSGFNFVYKYNNVLYAAVEPQDLYKSFDNGDSWTKYSTNSWILGRGKHNLISDSLVGFYQDNIFTQVWNGDDYTLRFLKNDGLEYKKITGIEFLGDTVYVGTLSGLFVKPLSNFFESKE